MAPKRRATASKGAAAPTPKKAKKEPAKSEHELKMEVLQKSLASEEYPIKGGNLDREFLCHALEVGFAGESERGEYQKRFIASVEDAVFYIKDHLNNKVAEQQTFLDEGEQMAINYNNARDACQTDLEEKVGILENKQAHLDQMKENLTAARAFLKESEKDQTNCEKDLDAKNKRKEVLAEANEWFTALLEVPDKASTKKLMNVLETMDLDRSLLAAIPNSLGNEPDARGLFDKMSIDYVGKQFAAQRAALDTDIATTEASLNEKNQTTESATAKKDECETARDEAQQEVKTATEIKKQATAALKSAEQDITQHAKNVENAAVRKEECLADVAEFSNTELAFCWLRDGPPKVEEEPAAPEPESSEPVSTEATESTEVLETEVETLPPMPESEKIPVETVHIEVPTEMEFVESAPVA